MKNFFGLFCIVCAMAAFSFHRQEEIKLIPLTGNEEQLIGGDDPLFCFASTIIRCQKHPSYKPCGETPCGSNNACPDNTIGMNDYVASYNSCGIFGSNTHYTEEPYEDPTYEYITLVETKYCYKLRYCSSSCSSPNSAGQRFCLSDSNGGPPAGENDSTVQIFQCGHDLTGSCENLLGGGGGTED